MFQNGCYHLDQRTLNYLLAMFEPNPWYNFFSPLDTVLYVADFYNLLNGKNTNSNFADNLRKWFTFAKKFPCKKIVPLFPLDKEDERPHTKCEKTK